MDLWDQIKNNTELHTMLMRECDICFYKQLQEIQFMENNENYSMQAKAFAHDASGGLNLDPNEKILHDKEDIPRWGKILNARWTEYVLSAMDIGSDSYALMVLSKEDFEKARELAKVILHRIAVIEEM